MSADEITPRDEPEVRRARGQRHVACCNTYARKPYVKIYIALELAQQAHEAHGLPYEPGLSAMGSYPPDRFTWIYDPAGEAKDCVKLRDDKTGRVVVWLHV